MKNPKKGNKMNRSDFQKHAKRTARPSPVLKDCLAAFFVGGLICTVAEALNSLYSMRLSEDDAAALTSTTLIFVAVMLTGIGVFDRIASFAGAGTLVPITGFANAVVSPAIDFKSEGFVTGTAAKMFIIAGPVLVFGIAASVVYGLLLVLLG